jgi:photosystem II stability/assembly factor-like uncharacterized protein
VRQRAASRIGPPVAALALAAAAGLAFGRPPTTESIHHIHGLALDRGDPEVLYVATHTGLVRLGLRATPEWLGAQRFDLMGFTAHPRDRNVMYASGHPDLDTYRREGVGNLGLLVSRDGGRTWRSVALAGEADFHALALSPRNGGELYGWSVAGRAGLYRIATQTWATERLSARGLADVLALAASPDDGRVLLAGTASGFLVSRDRGSSWSRVDGVQRAAVTAVSYHVTDAARAYAYVDRAGSGLLRTVDGGRTWEPTGFFSGLETPVVALAAGPGDHVAVATSGADVARSRDGGRTWQTLVRRGRPADR